MVNTFRLFPNGDVFYDLLLFPNGDMSRQLTCHDDTHVTMIPTVRGSLRSIPERLRQLHHVHSR